MWKGNRARWKFRTRCGWGHPALRDLGNTPVDARCARRKTGPALRTEAGWLYLVGAMQRQRKIAGIGSDLLRWFAASARDLPWRRTRDGYAIWISEIMLQQTQVKTVIPYWERWMRELPTIDSLAKAKPARLHKLWEGLGYYTRVRNVQKAAQQIVERHKGEFPREFEDILELPGIGRYTAGAIASIAFGQPRPILDGNVIRVLTRLFAIEANPREPETNARLWKIAEQLVSAAAPECSHLNQSLMELGALICTPREPCCAECPVRKHCAALRTGDVTRFPNLPERAAATSRRFVALVLRRGDRYLVRQRPAGVVNAHLWEFPNAEFKARGKIDPAEVFQSQISPASGIGSQIAFRRLCTIKH